MSRIIEIRIDKEGKTHLDVQGVEDATCEDLTKVFEDALGTKVETERKPAYFSEIEGIKLYEED